MLLRRINDGVHVAASGHAALIYFCACMDCCKRAVLIIIVSRVVRDWVALMAFAIATQLHSPLALN